MAELNVFKEQLRELGTRRDRQLRSERENLQQEMEQYTERDDVMPGM